MTILMKAIQFAHEHHRGQFRKGTGHPYICHPASVANLLVFYKKSHRLEELVCAAYLHDILKDTSVTYQELVDIFGSFIAGLVLELTNDKKEISIKGKTPYLIDKMSRMSKWGLTLKLCDRLDNIRDNPSLEYVESTLDILDALFKDRKRTSTQMSIEKEILRECEKFYNNRLKEIEEGRL